jgi:feruloyl esterase
LFGLSGSPTFESGDIADEYDLGAVQTAIQSSQCAALSQVLLPDTEIVSASVQSPNEPVVSVGVRGAGEARTPVSVTVRSSFCRVAGRIRPEPGSDISFEVWLPLDAWNGRFMGVGNGGFAGSIRYRDLAEAVNAGYATASTDTGHDESVTPLASWAPGNPEKLRDYGWRAVHLMTQAAKQLVVAFYDRPAKSSYFQSCSNGGRQGLMEAARFPNDYDGILAGAPAAQMTKAVMSQIWVQQVQARPGAAFRPEQMAFLQAEVLDQCDAIDGLEDRLVDNPSMCRIDVSQLSCENSGSASCFSPPQVEALRLLYSGPPTSNGRNIAFPFPASGAEAGRPIPFLGWDGYIAAGGERPPQQIILTQGVLGDLATPPLASIEDFDWETDPAQMSAALGGVLDVEPDLTEYFERGGKLIIYHGWADAAIPPQQTIDFYTSVLQQSGPAALHSSRLFMIPGMQHCYGGTGAELFGATSPAGDGAQPENNISMALRLWVETGRVPDAVIGTRTPSAEFPEIRPGEERLHCAFPKRAVLMSGTDPGAAENYVCQSN